MGPCFCPLESHQVLQGWASKLSSWLPCWPSSPTHISCSKESDPIRLCNVTGFSLANMQWKLHSILFLITDTGNWLVSELMGKSNQEHREQLLSVKRWKKCKGMKWTPISITAENVYECRTLSVINNLSSDLVEDEEGYLLLTNSLSNVSTLHTN